MARRKQTLSRMPVTTREIAKLIDELESVARRLNNKLVQLERLERDAGDYRRTEADQLARAMAERHAVEDPERELLELRAAVHDVGPGVEDTIEQILRIRAAGQLFMPSDHPDAETAFRHLPSATGQGDF